MPAQGRYADKDHWPSRYGLPALPIFPPPTPVGPSSESVGLGSPLWPTSADYGDFARPVEFAFCAWPAAVLTAGVEQSPFLDQKDLARIEVAQPAQVPLGIGQTLHASMRDQQVPVACRLDEMPRGMGCGVEGVLAGIRPFQERSPHRGDSVASGPELITPGL